MNKLLVSTILAAVAFCLVGCVKPNPPKTYKDIDAVWFHEHDKYSFTFVEDGQLKNVGPGNFCLYTCNVFPDLKPDEKMWARVTQTQKNGTDIVTHYEIHVHGIKDIQPAGWDHGKFGSGTTSKVETK